MSDKKHPITYEEILSALSEVEKSLKRCPDSPEATEVFVKVWNLRSRIEDSEYQAKLINHRMCHLDAPFDF